MPRIKYDHPLRFYVYERPPNGQYGRVNKISAVYVIRNTENGKSYVGYSSDVRFRFYTHRYHLERGTHFNIYLQRAWKKYGAAKFSFEVLEECDRRMYVIYEQEWMEKLGAHVSRGGYNMLDSVLKPPGTLGVVLPHSEALQKEFEIYDPSGKLHKAKGIRRFAIDNGLCYKGLSSVLSGKLSNHQGWRTTLEVPYQKVVPPRCFFSPEGKEHWVRSCRELSDLVGVNAKALFGYKVKSHYGWTYPGAFCKVLNHKKKRKTLPEEWLKIGKNPHNDRLKARFKLISPDDEIIDCEGVRETSKKLGISRGGILKIRKGESECVKGYRLAS